MNGRSFLRPGLPPGRRKRSSAGALTDWVLARLYVREEGEEEGKVERKEREREMRWKGLVNDEDSPSGGRARHHSRGMEIRRR